MFQIRMNSLLRIIIASGETPALPVRTNWPVHKALAWVGAESVRFGSNLADIISISPDPDAGQAVRGVAESLSALVDEGFLVLEGNGYTARWRVSQAAATSARRGIMREDVATARILVHAGQRLATWASTALKNADRAAASWAPTISESTPTVRQPPVLALL
jgi:hypothetical protein